MTELDDALVPAAAALLTQFGKTISIEEVTKVYDETTGKTTIVVVATYTPKAALETYSIALVNGDTVRHDDLKVTIAAQSLAFTPTIGWKVTIDTVEWRILRVEPLYSGNLVAAWVMQLRR